MDRLDIWIVAAVEKESVENGGYSAAGRSPDGRHRSRIANPLRSCRAHRPANPTTHHANCVSIAKDPDGISWIYAAQEKSVLRRKTLLWPNCEGLTVAGWSDPHTCELPSSGIPLPGGMIVHRAFAMHDQQLSGMAAFSGFIPVTPPSVVVRGWRKTQQ
jgi:hypothetical protein